MRGVLGRLVTSDSLLEGILNLANAAFTAWSGYMPFLAMECLLDRDCWYVVEIVSPVGLGQSYRCRSRSEGRVDEDDSTLFREPSSTRSSRTGSLDELEAASSTWWGARCSWRRWEDGDVVVLVLWT